MKTLNVAVVSSQNHFCDADKNISHFDEWIGRAKAAGARLVCFPELALNSYTTEPAVLDSGESVPGPSVTRLEELAAMHDVYLSVGMVESEADKRFITQVVIGPDGYMGKYRKTNLAPPNEVNLGFTPGESFETFDIDGFKLGVLICYDGRFDDTLQKAIDAQVDIIHHPHGNPLVCGENAEEWTRGKLGYFPRRAINARAYILINNSAGSTRGVERTETFGSGALVIDPLGQAVRTTQPDNEEKMLTATLQKPWLGLLPDWEQEMQHLTGGIKRK